MGIIFHWVNVVKNEFLNFCMFQLKLVNFPIFFERKIGYVK
jgi:hypothetical protein